MVTLLHKPDELMKKKSSDEFFKLDKIDFRVACWILEKHPKALYSYLEYIAPEYQSRGIELDIDKLYKELIESL